MTKNLSDKLVNEAKGICGGMYSLNAKTAVGYAFAPMDSDPDEIAVGEFVFRSELEKVAHEYGDCGGIIMFETKTLEDYQSGEKVKL